MALRITLPESLGNDSVACFLALGETKAEAKMDMQSKQKHKAMICILMQCAFVFNVSCAASACLPRSCPKEMNH